MTISDVIRSAADTMEAQSQRGYRMTLCEMDLLATSMRCWATLVELQDSDHRRVSRMLDEIIRDSHATADAVASGENVVAFRRVAAVMRERA